MRPTHGNHCLELLKSYFMISQTRGCVISLKNHKSQLDVIAVPMFTNMETAMLSCHNTPGVVQPTQSKAFESSENGKRNPFSPAWWHCSPKFEEAMTLWTLQMTQRYTVVDTVDPNYSQIVPNLPLCPPLKSQAGSPTWRRSWKTRSQRHTNGTLCPIINQISLQFSSITKLQMEYQTCYRIDTRRIILWGTIYILMSKDDLPPLPPNPPLSLYKISGIKTACPDSWLRSIFVLDQIVLLNNTGPVSCENQKKYAKLSCTSTGRSKL